MSGRIPTRNLKLGDSDLESYCRRAERNGIEIERPSLYRDGTRYVAPVDPLEHDKASRKRIRSEEDTTP
jgi:hypothetical protein